MTNEVAMQEPATTQVAQQRILVLDFGSQYARLIARRVREQNVFCEIVRHDITPEAVQRHQAHGLILSGGPSSVYSDGAPKCDSGIFRLGIPVLGICYGIQLACDELVGESASKLLQNFAFTLRQTMNIRSGGGIALITQRFSE